MSAKIIDGKAISLDILVELVPRIEKLKADGVTPGLSVILVGDDPASQSYVRSKERVSAKIGIRSDTQRLPKATSQTLILDLIAELNSNPDVHGILVQLPLPDKVEEAAVLEAILPSKDVDGFSPISTGRLLSGQDCFAPATPAGIMELLKRSGNPPDGKHAVILGRSNIVGKPLAALLIQKRKGANATVTVCHSKTKNIEEITKQADILVAAMGQPKFVTADMVKEGAVVIDVGTNRVEDSDAKKGYRIVGDVDFDGVKEKARAITPVPGGVGPMTITMLMANTVLAAESLTGH
jgi:methylenetetrahydrofolate dehydrogenase (NADP+)/methenyltetrahydrofolate cyclohydrolase